MTRLGLDDPGSIPSRGIYFIFVIASRPPERLWNPPNLLSIVHRGWGVVFPGVKQPRREATPPLPHTSSRRGA